MKLWDTVLLCVESVQERKPTSGARARLVLASPHRMHVAALTARHVRDPRRAGTRTTDRD